MFVYNVRKKLFSFIRNYLLFTYRTFFTGGKKKMSEKILFIDIQFVVGNGRQLFVKELAMLRQGSIIPTLYFFKPPYPREELNDAITQHGEYICDNINNLQWNDGILLYNDIADILKSFSQHKIYVKGIQKKNFLRQYLQVSTEIVELEDEIPKLGSLRNYKAYCEIHYNKTKNHRCAVQNCINIYMYMLQNNIIEY